MDVVAAADVVAVVVVVDVAIVADVAIDGDAAAVEYFEYVAKLGCCAVVAEGLSIVAGCCYLVVP